jgi:hypothetical protein
VVTFAKRFLAFGRGRMMRQRAISNEASNGPRVNHFAFREAFVVLLNPVEVVEVVDHQAR